VLAPAWGLLAEAGVPVVVHCGHGPRRGAHTGLDVFAEVLRAHPRLRAVIAHAGLPDFDSALGLLVAHLPSVIDTTMVGTPFTEAFAPLPRDWAPRLADVADRVVFGSDFPNIPYAYAEQVRAVAGWAAADDRLGEPFLRSVLHHAPARLLGLPVRLTISSLARLVARHRGSTCGRRRRPGGSGMIRRRRGVTLVQPPQGRRKGVNGFDSGCRSWGSVPRKATMISLTMCRKKTSADNSRTDQAAFALAG